MKIIILRRAINLLLLLLIIVGCYLSLYCNNKNKISYKTTLALPARLTSNISLFFAFSHSFYKKTFIIIIITIYNMHILCIIRNNK